jgi:hypothetical protein
LALACNGADAPSTRRCRCRCEGWQVELLGATGSRGGQENLCCLSGSPTADKSCNVSTGGRGYEFLTVLNRQATGSGWRRFSAVLFAGTSARSSRKALRLYSNTALAVENTPWPQSKRQPLVSEVSANFTNRQCRVVRVADPHGRILGFLDRSRYFFFQVAPQLYSRG